MAVRLPTPTPAIPTHSNSVFGRGRMQNSVLTVQQSTNCRYCPQCVVMMQPPNVHSSPDKAAKDTFCRTIVSHTLKKYSTRPYDTTRSNLTESRSRHAARSEGAAQKSALHRDQRLLAATARIDPAATGLRCSARSIGSGDQDECGGFQPLDRTDQAATARNGVPQLLMSVESLAGAADRPV